jgi:hypothetical protein
MTVRECKWLKEHVENLNMYLRGNKVKSIHLTAEEEKRGSTYGEERFSMEEWDELTSGSYVTMEAIHTLREDTDEHRIYLRGEEISDFYEKKFIAPSIKYSKEEVEEAEEEEYTHIAENVVIPKGAEECMPDLENKHKGEKAPVMDRVKYAKLHLGIVSNPSSKNYGQPYLGASYGISQYGFGDCWLRFNEDGTWFCENECSSRETVIAALTHAIYDAMNMAEMEDK